MHVRVSGLVWLPKSGMDAEGLKGLKKSLTIVPRKTIYDQEEKPSPVLCWAETLDEFGVPRDYFFDTAKQQHTVSWDLSDGLPVSYESLLRQDGAYAEQKTALDVLEDHLRAFDSKLALGGPMEAGKHLGGLLQADPAFGKTNTALALAHRLGRTALVVVHKEFLLTQWIKRIRSVMPDAKVGIVREDECDFEGKDFVVAMVQSLSLEGADGKQRYPLDFYRWPGIVFLDEVHRIGALTWAPTPRMFPAKWRIGLSATPRRKDGADKVFWWHLGRVLYQAKTKRPVLNVRMVESGSLGPDFIHRDGISPSVVVNILAKLNRRNDLIISEIVKALKSPSARKIMVLSERLEHLRELDKLLDAALARAGIRDVTTGFYVGEWFTGEQTKKLAKGHWEMDEKGIEDARKVIYASLARRQDPMARRNDAGERLVYVPWLDKVMGRALKTPAEIEEAIDAIVSGEATELMHWQRLDELAPERLFELAKHYDIKQKVVLKKRRRTEAELSEAERARVIWASYQMCSEGIDIAAVDTLGFATPVSDVEQAYGRGRRVCVPKSKDGDKSPEVCAHLCPWRKETCSGKAPGLVFDVVDDRIPLAKRRKGYRLEFYSSVGARVAVHGP